MKKGRVNPFLLAYFVALFGLACVGYYVAEFQIKSNRQLEDSNQYFATDLAYYDLPPINLALTSYSADKSGKVRMDISLEVAEKDLMRLKDYQPRIMDTVINYVHQFDIEQIQPAKAMPVLHKDLLDRVNIASRPVAVHNIVFRQFLVQ